MPKRMRHTDTRKIFLSYARKDRRQVEPLLEQLSPLVRQGLVKYWDDQQLLAGEERGEILQRFDEADIILCLISPGFISSDYCYDVEMKRAWKRWEDEGTTIIPILLKPVDYKGLPFNVLQKIPRSGKWITDHYKRDRAYLEVAREIAEVVDVFKERHR